MRGGNMDDFRIEYFIESGNAQSIRLSSLDESEIEGWKKDMESRALSEYYNQKIKISSKKI